MSYLRVNQSTGRYEIMDRNNILIAQHTYLHCFQINDESFNIEFAVVDGEVLAKVNDLDGALGYVPGSLGNLIGPWSRKKHPFDGDRDAPLVQGPNEIRTRYLTRQGLDFVCNKLPRRRSKERRRAFFVWFLDRFQAILEREKYLLSLTPTGSVKLSNVTLFRYALKNVNGDVLFEGLDSWELAKALAYSKANTLAYMVVRAATYLKGSHYMLIDESRLPPNSRTYTGMSKEGVKNGICLLGRDTALALTKQRRKTKGKQDHVYEALQQLLESDQTTPASENEETPDISENTETPQQLSDQTMPTSENTQAIQQTPDPSPVTVDLPSGTELVTPNKEASEALTKRVRFVMPKFGKVRSFDNGNYKFVSLSLSDFNELLAVVVAVASDSEPDLDIPDVDSMGPMEAIHALSGVLTKAPEILQHLNNTKNQWTRQVELVDARIDRVNALHQNGVITMTSLLSKVE